MTLEESTPQNKIAMDCILLAINFVYFNWDLGGQEIVLFSPDIPI